MHVAHACTHSHQQKPTVLVDRSRKGQKVTKQVQLFELRADVSTASEQQNQQQQNQQQQQQQQQQQSIPETADGNKQRFSKVTGIFKSKRAASKAVSADSASLAAQSVQEAVPDDLIPAVRQPSAVVQQADPPALITKATVKSPQQVRLMHAHTACRAVNDAV